MSVENREVRGWILRICERAQPYGASFKVIETALLESGFHMTPSELKSHLLYLEHKGYIHRQEYEKNNVKRRVNFITPQGIDLIEGNVPCDPGVLLNG